MNLLKGSLCWRVIWIGRLLLVAVLAGLVACGMVVERDGPPRRDVDYAGLPDAVPKNELHSRHGNPTSYEVMGKTYHTLTNSEGFFERGIASWYGTKFHGRRTSSGERYDMYKMTAAHRTLPLPTYVEVKNLSNARAATVRVNDRGPFHDNRIIDLSYAAAKKLGIVKAGTALVSVRAVHAGPPRLDAPQVRNATQKRPEHFYLQFGAFHELSNAERMRDRIATIIEELVEVQAANSDGSVIHRVRIGPLASINIADRLVAALSRVGIREHVIVVP